MKKNILYKIVSSIVLTSLVFANFLVLAPQTVHAVKIGWNAPSFDQQFQDPLLKGDSTVINPNKTWGLDSSKSIRENVEILFSPSNQNSAIWRFIRVVVVGLVILHIALAGMTFITNANNAAKLKEARTSLLQIIIWWVVVFAATWLLQGVFVGIGWGTLSPSETIVETLTGKIFFSILTFLKSAAFFVAIVMMVYYWFKMVGAMDKADLANKAKKWIVNILLALLFIKVIDFIFFIAQNKNFQSSLQDFIFNISKVLWWAMGAAMVFALIFAGFKYISAQWDEGKMKDAQKMITKIFYAVLIVFLFLLVTRQIIEAFTN